MNKHSRFRKFLSILAAVGFIAMPMAEGSAATLKDAPARNYLAPFRTDTLDIPLKTGGAEGSELEYKVRMKAGDALIYSWTVSGVRNSEEFYYDFHGETPAASPGAQPDVVEYKQSTSLGANGMLIAPNSGIHGWYWQNRSVSNAVVHLRLSGFYTLISPGEDGNEAGILPKDAKN